MLGTLTNLIDPFSNRGIPQVVYHYTSMESLLSIVKKQTMYATNMLYLQDVSEFNYLKSMIKRVDKTEMTDDERSIADVISGLEDHTKYYQYPYVASFTTERDSLLHWREFCHNGNGVCIGFSSDALKNLRSNPFIEPKIDESNITTAAMIEEQLSNLVNIAIYNAVYLDIEKTWDQKSAMQKCCNEAKEIDEMVKADGGKKEKTCIDILAKLAINSLSPIVKNGSYSGEREVRVVATPIWDSCNRVDFRQSNASLIPYMKLHFSSPYRRKEDNLSTNEDSLYFIKEIIVGPSPNMNLTKGALEGYFNKLGCNVNIDTTSILFREV